MNNNAFEISSVLLDLVITKFDNDFSDIKETKFFWHQLNYLLISTVNCKILSKTSKKNIKLDDFERLGLIPSSLLSFYYKNYNLVEICIEHLSDQILSFDCPIELLREHLICLELSIRKNSITLHKGKNLRDSTGSYYTPYHLAKSIVQKTFSSPRIKGLTKKKIKNLKIADFSCGGGEFFCATQEYLLEKFGVPYEASASLFWGIDVDPIILQITICRLLQKASIKNWRNIISHFRLGNPLISTEKECSFDEKNKLFALSRFYAKGMGLTLNDSNIGKYDIVFGNPPWEKIRFEERKFFHSFAPEISEVSKKDERAKAIGRLNSGWNNLYIWYKEISGDYLQFSSRTYSHSIIKKAVSGELNTYALFTELSYNLLDSNGICTVIVKNTLTTAPSHKKIWEYFLSNKAIESLYFFDNKKKIFNIDARERFAVLSLSKSRTNSFLFAAGLVSSNDYLECNETTISANDVKAINPFTSMIPNVASNDDIEFLLKAHKKLPLFEEIYPNCHFGRLVHLTSHSEHIIKRKAKDYLPIYEGKFIEQYDARFSTFAGMTDSEKYAHKASARKSNIQNGKKPIPESRYYIEKAFWKKLSLQYSEKYSLCWRSLTSPTNARTTVAMILPEGPTCQSIQLLQTNDNVQLLLLLGLFNSLPFDYFVRLKMPGIDLTQSVIKQIPVPCVSTYEKQVLFNGKRETLKTHILSSVVYLLRNEDRLNDLMRSIDYPIYKIDDRNTDECVKKSLDELFAMAYQIDRKTYKKMVNSFPKY